MDMNAPVNVPVDDPNADTEWNDILRKHGVIPEKPPSPTPQIEAALLQARELAHENRLEGKNLDELDELEDEEDEDFLDHYRRKRMAEMSELQIASIFGTVHPVQKSEYPVEVTEASAKAVVLVLLTSSSGTNDESRLMMELWRQLASKFGEVKFCQMQANLCIEGYPDKNTPTVLCYKDGDLKRQVVTLAELAGTRTRLGDLEKLLLDLSAIKHGDSRLSKNHDEHEGVFEARVGGSGKIWQSSRKDDDEEDSDWD